MSPGNMSPFWNNPLHNSLPLFGNFERTAAITINRINSSNYPSEFYGRKSFTPKPTKKKMTKKVIILAVLRLDGPKHIPLCQKDCQSLTLLILGCVSNL